MYRRPAVIVDMDGTLCDVATVLHLQAEPDGFTASNQSTITISCMKATPRMQLRNLLYVVGTHRVSSSKSAL